MKVHSISIKAPADGRAPKSLKLFVNKPSMDCSDGETMVADQEIELSAEQLGERLELKFVKFQNVDRLTLFIHANQGAEDSTALSGIKLWGAGLAQTNMSEFKRVNSGVLTLTLTLTLTRTLTFELRHVRRTGRGQRGRGRVIFNRVRRLTWQDGLLHLAAGGCTRNTAGGLGGCHPGSLWGHPRSAACVTRRMLGCRLGCRTDPIVKTIEHCFGGIALFGG